MKIIGLLTVMAMVLQGLFGTRSSVGGPLTMLLIVFVAMLAVAIREAWLNERGALGWLLNIVASVIGGVVAVSLSGMMMDTVRPYLHLQGSLASSQHPVLYIFLAGATILTLLGSWGTIQLVNRCR